MAVTLDAAALHVVGKPEGKLTDRERADLSLLTEWATRAVADYLNGAPAPAEVVKAAELRATYYDWHARLARRPADGGMLDQVFRRDKSTNPLRASGAMALLSPYLRRRAAT